MDKKNILIVEDEAIVAADLAGKLRQLGYEVAGTTASGEESIKLASRMRPDLVLMDIRLEGAVDGIEAAEVIHREQDLPVIYLTAFSDPPTLERAKLTGPFGYILKPFEERDLATQIEMALYRHQADRQIRKQRDELEMRVQERTAELRDAIGELELRNRELHDFAFIASHDLREPLRKIQIFGEMIKERFAGDLPDQARDYFTRMQNAANRMDQLLSALLRYSRISKQHEPFVEADLNVLVREAAADLAIIEERKANVLFGELPVLEVDSSQIRQLFGNLIQNAIKFNVSSCPEIKIHGKVNNGLCSIYVEDNGIGFEEQYLDKIFSPFQRLHNRDEYEGMGMGLAICHKIVEMHGGNITASSRPGDGATFIISLPMRH
jgi:signal transduction histidine kinase